MSRAEREALIASTAYRYAEARGFVGGDPTADWLRAEEEVSRIGIPARPTECHEPVEQ